MNHEIAYREGTIRYLRCLTVPLTNAEYSQDFSLYKHKVNNVDLISYLWDSRIASNASPLRGTGCGVPSAVDIELELQLAFPGNR